MTKIEIENIEYNVPSSFDEVTIDQFAKIVLKLETERDEFTMNTEIVKILTGINIADLPFEIGVKVFSLMPFLNDISVINDQNPFTEAYFIHDGEQYNVPQTINFITFTQYWNLDKLLEIYPGNKILDQAAFIIAMLCLKDGEQYNYGLAKQREQVFKKLPCTLACRLINGFFLQSRISNETMKLYLIAQEELDRQTAMLETLIKDGSGTRLSGLFARNYVKLLKQPKKGKLVTYLTTLLGKKIWKIFARQSPKKVSKDK